MKKHKKLKVGDFIKCTIAEKNHTTINKLYKIEDFYSRDLSKKNGIYEKMTVEIIDNKGYPTLVNLYERIYAPIHRVSYGVFFKNFFKILSGTYNPTKLIKETIWFVPATKLERVAIKYNL